MTISTTTNRVTYTGNGVTVAFSFLYAFFAQADLVVVETIIATGVQTTKALTTDYTISGSVDALGHYSSGGTVTAVTAPASTVTWTIYRDPTATQTTDLVENDPMPAESIEAALDYQTMLNQRTRDIAARSLQQPEGDSATIDRLPAKVDRASMYLGFDADGDPIALDAPADTTAVSAFMATVLDDTTAAIARTTLGVGSLMPSVRRLVGSRHATTTRYTLSNVDAVTLYNPSTGDSILRINPGAMTVNALTAGPAANGRDQAAAFTNPSWVHLYYIWDGATLALIASTTAPPTGPALPTGYTHWAYATTIYYTTEFAEVYVVGGRVYNNLSGFSGLNSASYVTIGSLAAIVPVIATHVFGSCSISGTSTGGGALDMTLHVTSRDTSPYLAGAQARLFQAGINTTSQVLGNIPFEVPIITNQTVYYAVLVTSGTSGAGVVTVQGYRVPNGDA